MQDFNKLEKRAAVLRDQGRYSDALRIYLFMADGDTSLDGGHLGMKIAQTYEAMGDLAAARYWAGRGVEENPQAPDRVATLNRLPPISIDDLL